MPRTTHRSGLDGLRGVAVVAVILFHGGVPWAHGGFLGVEVFFVLSGYLITSLLVGEWLRSGRIALGAFWARRARRLAPALLAVTVVIGIYYAARWPEQTVPNLWRHAAATLLYYGNWHEVASGTSYFAGSGPVSPFQHTWSLAIEEQFYGVWPLLVLGVLSLAGRRLSSSAAGLRVLLGLTVAGAVGSAVESALLLHGGRGLDRVYYGTDTWACGLLTGAALAIALATVAAPERPARRRWGALAAAALAAVAVLIGAAWGPSAWLYPYGLTALDLMVAVVIAAIVRAPGSLPDRLLSSSPLRATGRISYGLYLWHFPLFLWLNVAATGVGGAPLLALRLAVTALVAALSYVLVEQPIRCRRRPAWLAYGLTSLGGLAAATTILAASLASSLPTAVLTADAISPGLAGDQRPCTVTLRDAPGYGLAPVAPAGVEAFESSALGAHALRFDRTGHATFRTCPPKRILLIGDSIAFSLGEPMLAGEQRYGVEIADAAMLGCAFTTRGELGVGGTWARPDGGCQDPLAAWVADERRFDPDEVVVELGYRDEFDWRWDGHVVHLGQPRFDAYVRSRIEAYVRALGGHGVRLLLLTVPFTDPPAQADGSPAPAASPARHAEIDAMLAAAARRDHGDAAVLDVDRTISPGGHYDATVDGQPCRLDGIHLDAFCSALLQPRVLGAARRLLDARRRP